MVLTATSLSSYVSVSRTMEVVLERPLQSYTRKDSEKEDKGYEFKDEQLVGMAQPRMRGKDEQ